jgi:DNA-binding transcriptional ArsR family regulator
VTVFEVLADPTRRRILELVAGQEQPAGWLAENFDMSGPAVSKHLRVLRDAGLVSVRQAGTQRLYRLDPGPLSEAEQWIATTTATWSANLDALEAHLDQTNP